VIESAHGRRTIALMQWSCFLSHYQKLSKMIEDLRSSIQVGDYIKFLCNNASNNSNFSLGEVIHCNTQSVKVKLFHPMDSATLQRFTLQPISPTEYPLAFQDQMLEVYKSSTEMYVERSFITDIAFVVPMAEVESGMFYLSGAENVFCIRYMLEDNVMKTCAPCLYFSRYMVEPICVRLFTALNTLSLHLRRSMYHQSESSISKKTFRLPLFPMECFWYLVFRIGTKGIGVSTQRKQCVIKYFNTLRMECYSKCSTLSFLRILSYPALEATRNVLGLGVGLGLAKRRPTKAMPVGYCTIGGILTSVECGLQVPYEVLLNPHCNYAADGIDFIYSEHNRSLSCTIRFTKIVVKVESDATSRIATAEVTNTPQSGVYLNVWFKHNGCLLEVVAINGDIVTCSYVEETSENINLPLQVVAELVAKFGTN
jgi:hypothetical protein